MVTFRRTLVLAQVRFRSRAQPQLLAALGERDPTEDIKGSFSTTITINEVEDWPACPDTDTSPFLAQTVFLMGTGVVRLG